MANYSTLKANVASVVRTNGQNAITGANLQTTLYGMIESLGADYQLMGIATASTNPGTPDQNVAYLATTGSSAVTFTNFTNSGTALSLAANKFGVLKYNGTWTIESADLPSGGGSSSSPVFVYNPNIAQGRSNPYTSAANARNAVPNDYRTVGLIIVYKIGYTTSASWTAELYTNNGPTYLSDDSWSVIIPPLEFNQFAQGQIMLNGLGDKLTYSKSGDVYSISIPDSTYVACGGLNYMAGAGPSTVSIEINPSSPTSPGAFFYLCYTYDYSINYGTFSAKETPGQADIVCGLFHVCGATSISQTLYTTSGF